MRNKKANYRKKSIYLAVFATAFLFVFLCFFQALAFTEPPTGPDDPRLPQQVGRASLGEQARLFLPSFIPWLLLILAVLLAVQYVMKEKEKGKSYGQIREEARIKAAVFIKGLPARLKGFFKKLSSKK